MRIAFKVQVDIILFLIKEGKSIIKILFSKVQDSPNFELSPMYGSVTTEIQIQLCSIHVTRWASLYYDKW